MRAGNLGGCLVGLDFDNVLIFLDNIAFADENIQNVRAVDVVSQFRKSNFNGPGILIRVEMSNGPTT